MSRRRSVVGSPFIGGTPVPGPLTATRFVASADGTGSAGAFSMSTNAHQYWDATKGWVLAMGAAVDRIMARVSGTTEVSSGVANTVSVFRLTNTSGDFDTFITTATPEGAITGSIGDKCIDVTNGREYLKRSGSATNTGWVQIDRCESGAYTPTATAVTNLDSVTPSLSYYVRVGDIVTLCLSGTLDATASGNIVFRASLPIASNFGATTDATGTVGAQPMVGGENIVQADTTNDELTIRINPSLTTSVAWAASAQYRVLP